MIRTLTALLGLTLAGCVQIVSPAPLGPGASPGASLGALLDAAIAANPPYQPQPGEYVPPKPPY